jgi:hypothetical protein
MKKSWSTPSVSTYGNVAQITTDVTVTCPDENKEFGDADGFVVAGQSIKCASSF